MNSSFASLACSRHSTTDKYFLVVKNHTSLEFKLKYYMSELEQGQDGGGLPTNRTPIRASHPAHQLITTSSSSTRDTTYGMAFKTRDNKSKPKVEKLMVSWYIQ